MTKSDILDVKALLWLIAAMVSQSPSLTWFFGGLAVLYFAAAIYVFNNPKEPRHE